MKSINPETEWLNLDDMSELMFLDSETTEFTAIISGIRHATDELLRNSHIADFVAYPANADIINETATVELNINEIKNRLDYFIGELIDNSDAPDAGTAYRETVGFVFLDADRAELTFHSSWEGNNPLNDDETR